MQNVTAGMSQIREVNPTTKQWELTLKRMNKTTVSVVLHL